MFSFVSHSPPPSIRSLPSKFRTLPSPKREVFQNPLQIRIPNPKDHPESDPIKSNMPTRIGRVVDRSGPAIQSHPNFVQPGSPIMPKPSPLSKRTIFNTTTRKKSMTILKKKLDPLFL